METITIKFQSNIKEKLIAFLNSFSKNELHVIEEETLLLKTRLTGNIENNCT